MLVSFIIPAYNASDMIVRCLDSIYALSLKPDEFEVIVIDDASSDNTVEVVEQYCQKVYGVKCKVYDNFTLLRQPENHRQGAARNRGVKVAKGEYICFVDADDAVAEGIEKAIRMAKEKQTDMMVLHYANVNENGEITPEAEKLSFAKGQIFTGIEMQNTHPFWCSAPWGYIYGKKFLEDVNFPFVEDVLYEDSDFVAVHLYYAKRMAYSLELGYLTYYREGSTTRSTNHKNVADYLLLGTRMLSLYERIMGDVLCVKSDVSEVDVEKFAEGILEGACWNVQKSCRRLIKLDGMTEVRAYYERIDANVNRDDLWSDKRYRKYYWNTWTTMCIKHKSITIALLMFLIPIYNIISSLK